MKRFTSVLCAAVLTLAMSSVSFAGTIYGRSETTTGTSKPGTIYGIYGHIYGFVADILIP